MKQKNLFWKFAFSPKIVKKAIKVALVVGIILNLINQGEKIISLDLGSINLFKFILTFFVPYGVSAYSAAQANLTFTAGDTATLNSEMKCENCTNKENFVRGEIVTKCNKCGTQNWNLLSIEESSKES